MERTNYAVVNFAEEKKKILTNADHKEERKRQNKLWKTRDRMSWSELDPNPRHSLYYKEQLSELVHEWETFQSILSKELPVTVRLGLCPPIVAQATAGQMRWKFNTMRGRYVEIGGKAIKENIVQPVTWCSGSWELAADSSTLSHSDGLKPLHRFLLREVSLGHIVRQELASMIPALLLDVKYNHKVLDMCAAPGSKTMQLLSLMHEDARKNNRIATGMVVANDADPKRVTTLQARIGMHPNLLITCCRGEDLQKCIGAGAFDRIICDVPCSGDGTFRKFPHLWRLFRPRMGAELHSIQFQIAKSAIKLLKPGGRMIYSTCSINPLEDEAVVSALLTHFKGKIRLVDTVAEGRLPELKFRPGLTSWRCDKDILTVGEPDEAARAVSVSKLPGLLPSMLPPSEEDLASFHLERCLRIVPHDQNTGGFFVAVLERVLSPSSSSSSLVKKGVDAKTSSSAVVVVPKTAALATMKKLGYNPRHRSATPGDISSASNISSSTGADKGVARKNNTSNNKSSTGNSSAATAAESYPLNAFVYSEPERHTTLSATSSLGLQVHVSEENKVTNTNADNEDDEVNDSGEAAAAAAAHKEAASIHTLTGDDSFYLMETTPVEREATKNGKKRSAERSQEDSRLKKKPKLKPHTGIFGSRAQGWRKPEEEAEAEEEPISALPVITHISMISPSVHEALSSWAARNITVQAGAVVAHGSTQRSRSVYDDSLSTTTSWSIAKDGACYLTAFTASCVVSVSVEDFLCIAKCGITTIPEAGERAAAAGQYEDGEVVDRAAAANVAVTKDELSVSVSTIFVVDRRLSSLSPAELDAAAEAEDEDENEGEEEEVAEATCGAPRSRRGRDEGSDDHSEISDDDDDDDAIGDSSANGGEEEEGGGEGGEEEGEEEQQSDGSSAAYDSDLLESDEDEEEEEGCAPVLQGLTAAGCERLLTAYSKRLHLSKGDCIILKLDQVLLDRYLSGVGSASTNEAAEVVADVDAAAGAGAAGLDSSGKRRISKAERKKMKKQQDKQQQGAAGAPSNNHPGESGDEDKKHVDEDVTTYSSVSGDGVILLLRCIVNEYSSSGSGSGGADDHDDVDVAVFELLTKSQACESFVTSLTFLSKPSHRS